MSPGLRQRVENKIAFQFIFITETTQSFSNDAFCACKECQFEIIFSGTPLPARGIYEHGHIKIKNRSSSETTCLVNSKI